MTDTKTCPFCAEEIREAAVVCPYCRSGLGDSPDHQAYRNRPGRQIAGVASALAASSGFSVTLFRLGFVLLTFVSFIGPVLYVALWLVLPEEPGGVSPVGRFTRELTDEPAGASAPFDRFMSWLRPKVDEAIRWLRGLGRSSPEGNH